MSDFLEELQWLKDALYYEEPEPTDTDYLADLADTRNADDGDAQRKGE